MTVGFNAVEITGNTFKDISGDSIFASGDVTDLTIGANKHRYVTGAAVDLKTGAPALYGPIAIGGQDTLGCATASPNTTIRVGNTFAGGATLRVHGNRR